MGVQSIGIIGYGHFGKFLHRMAERFLPDVTVRVHTRSRRPGEESFFTTLEEAAASDVVILSVPIAAYEDWLHAIKPALGADTILLDVATVKLHTGNAIRSILPGQPYVSTHPMFGQESYNKLGGDVTGLRVVVTENNLPDGVLPPVLEKLRALGFDVVETTADQHDKEMAETLFLTHYVAQVIARGEFERTDIDTVSFGFLMDAVDAVRQDTKLFADVWRFNPYCRDVVERFTVAQRAVKNDYLSIPEEG